MATNRKPRITVDQMGRKELYAQLDKAKYKGPRSYTLAVLRDLLTELKPDTVEFIQVKGGRKGVEIYGRPGVTGPRKAKVAEAS